jgi:hypothetical protein
MLEAKQFLRMPTIKFRLRDALPHELVQPGAHHFSHVGCLAASIQLPRHSCGVVCFPLAAMNFHLTVHAQSISFSFQPLHRRRIRHRSRSLALLSPCTASCNRLAQSNSAECRITIVERNSVGNDQQEAMNNAGTASRLRVKVAVPSLPSLESTVISLLPSEAHEEVDESLTIAECRLLRIIEDCTIGGEAVPANRTGNGVERISRLLWRIQFDIAHDLLEHGQTIELLQKFCCQTDETRILHATMICVRRDAGLEGGLLTLLPRLRDR